MANTPTVLGNGPLEYTDPNSGKQISIPLSALFFDPTKGNQLSIDSTKWPDPSGTSVNVPGFVTTMLSQAVQQGLILPVPAAAPKPALVVTAQDAGSAGNNIKVVCAVTTSKVDPTQSKFSVTVTETDTYQGLSLNSANSNYIEKVLGSDTVPLSNPGLVHVVHSSLATTGIPASATAFKVTNPPTPKARADVKDATAKVLFTLEAKKDGKDGEQTSVLSVAQNATDPTAFDLSVQWTKAATGLTLSNVQANVASALGYESAVSPPSSGIYSLPSGTVQLSGGTDGSPGTAASAIVFSS